MDLEGEPVASIEHGYHGDAVGQGYGQHIHDDSHHTVSEEPVGWPDTT